MLQLLQLPEVSHPDRLLLPGTPNDEGLSCFVLRSVSSYD